ncbi:MAG: hypothetical protein P1U40_11265 [Coxiellaceae bacterium]|nr:hypothetical protein [Coxiellaceae bacterium]
MSRTSLERRICQLLQPGQRLNECVFDDQLSRINASDDLEQTVREIKDEMGDGSMWDVLNYLLLGDQGQENSATVKGEEFVRLVRLDESDPAFLGTLASMALDNELANIMLLGVIKSYGAERIASMDIDISAFPDVLEDPDDSDDDTSLQDMMSFPRSRYPALVQFRYQNVIRLISAEFPDMSNPLQARAVLQRANDGDFSAQMYLEDREYELNASTLSHLYPFDGLHPDSEGELCRIVQCGNTAAIELLRQLPDPSIETLKLVYYFPADPDVESRIIALAKDGCENAKQWVYRNRKSFKTEALLDYLHPFSNTVYGLFALVKQGYRSAVCKLDNIANTATDARSVGAQKALRQLSLLGYLNDDQRRNVSHLSAFFALPDAVTVEWDGRFRFALLDCGFESKPEDWGTASDMHEVGYDPRLAHYLVSEHLHTFCQMDENIHDRLLAKVDLGYRSQLQLQSKSGLLANNPYDMLRASGFVGINAGWSNSTAVEGGHAIRLAFLLIKDKTYLMMVNRGVYDAEIKIFYVTQPEKLADPAIVEKLQGDRAEHMYYFDNTLTIGDGIGSDFGLIPLQEKPVDKFERELRDSPPVVAGMIAALGTDEVSVPLMLDPLKRSTQKIGNCALASAYLDVLLRLAHEAMLKDPVIDATRAVLTLRNFRYALSTSMPMYKKIKTTGRVCSARLAIKIAVGDSMDAAKLDSGEVIVFKWIAQMYAKKHLNPDMGYGYTKELLRPAFEYLSTKADSADPIYEHNMQSIKTILGDSEYHELVSEYESSREYLPRIS